MQTYTYYICREHRGDGTSNCISEQKLFAAIEVGKQIPSGGGEIAARKKELLRFARFLEEGRKKGLLTPETYAAAAREYDQKRRELESEQRMMGQKGEFDVREMVRRIEVGAEHKVEIIYSEASADVFRERQRTFVPFGQDDPEGKPTSLVADFTKISETVDGALRGEQIQPILL